MTAFAKKESIVESSAAPALAGDGNEAIPVDPLGVASEKKVEIAEEEQPVKLMMECEMDAEEDEKRLPVQDRYAAVPEPDAIWSGPDLVIAKVRTWLPDRHERVPVEVHRTLLAGVGCLGCRVTGLL